MCASAAACTCYWAPTRTQVADQDTAQVSDQEAGESEDCIAELIATLWEQLQAERQAHAEARRLLAAALERIPAIEAPLEASETADEP